MAESEGIFLADGENIADVSPYEFDSVVEEAGNTFALDQLAAIHGSKGYKVAFGGANDGCWGNKTIVGQSAVYIRRYFKFPVGAYPHVGQGGSVNWYVFYLWGVPSWCCRLRFGSYSAGITLNGFQYHDTGGDHYADDVSKAVTLDIPHYIEYYYKVDAAAGEVRLRYDGELLVEIPGLDTSDRAIAGVYDGLMYSSPVPANGEYFYIDDVKGDTVLIGEYGKGPYRSNIIYAALIKRKQGRRISRR